MTHLYLLVLSFLYFMDLFSIYLDFYLKKKIKYVKNGLIYYYNFASVWNNWAT